MERTRAVLRRALSKSATPRSAPAPKEIVVVDMPEDIVPTNRIKERSPIKKTNYWENYMQERLEERVNRKLKDERQLSSTQSADTIPQASTITTKQDSLLPEMDKLYSEAVNKTYKFSLKPRKMALEVGTAERPEIITPGNRSTH